jgi:hypothetical protein
VSVSRAHRAAVSSRRTRTGDTRRRVVAQRSAPSKANHDTRPYYARLLRLQHVNPGGFVCFLLAEGVIAFAILMALAELVNWWAVPLLPLVVAGFVKINDIIAGVFARAELSRRYRSRPLRARGVAKVRGVATVIPVAVPAVIPVAVPAVIPVAVPAVDRREAVRAQRLDAHRDGWRSAGEHDASRDDQRVSLDDRYEASRDDQLGQPHDAVAQHHDWRDEASDDWCVERHEEPVARRRATNQRPFVR